MYMRSTFAIKLCKFKKKSCLTSSGICAVDGHIAGTIVVHFMTEEARSKYELEKLWTLGPSYDNQYRNMEHVLENNP